MSCGCASFAGSPFLYLSYFNRSKKLRPLCGASPARRRRIERLNAIRRQLSSLVHFALRAQPCADIPCCVVGPPPVAPGERQPLRCVILGQRFQPVLPPLRPLGGFRLLFPTRKHFVQHLCAFSLERSRPGFSPLPMSPAADLVDFALRRCPCVAFAGKCSVLLHVLAHDLQPALPLDAVPLAASRPSPAAGPVFVAGHYIAAVSIRVPVWRGLAERFNTVRRQLVFLEQLLLPAHPPADAPHGPVRARPFIVPLR